VQSEKHDLQRNLTAAGSQLRELASSKDPFIDLLQLQGDLEINILKRRGRARAGSPKTESMQELRLCTIVRNNAQCNDRNDQKCTPQEHKKKSHNE
jgi:hypothetical protein